MWVSQNFIAQKNYGRLFNTFLCCLITLVILYFPIGAEAQIILPSGVPANADILLWLSPDTALYRGNGNPASIGQRVDKWHDISGNGLVFDAPLTSNRPRLTTVDGFNYLDFVNGDFFENIGIRDSINGLTEFSIFVVIKSDRTNSDNGFLDSENPNGTDDKICLRYDANGANTRRTNLLKSGLGGNIANQQVETQNNTQTTDRQVLTITWSINNRLRVYINGVLNDTSNNTINSALSNIDKIIVGKGPKNTGSSSGWDGKIGTLMFFRNEFSQDTIDDIAQTIQTVISVNSGNWNTAGTWNCNCIPQPENNVEIASGHTVTLTSNTSIDNVVIKNGGILNAGNSNYTLTLSGDFTNDGTFIAGNSRVVMNHDKSQRIVGDIEFYDLQLDNSSTIDLELGFTTIQNSLEVNAGTLETNNKLILDSDNSGSAFVGPLSGGTINGDVEVRRYIDAGSTNWRLLSSPISNASLSEWNDDFITSGFPTSDFPSFPFVSIYNYDESATGTKDNGYSAPSNINQNILSGEGYYVWCGDTISGTQPFTIAVEGNLHTGSVNLPVTYTLDITQPLSENGWNLVGNPFASTIDWDSPNWNKSAIDDAIYIWDPDQELFATYVNGVSTNNGSRYIASSQGFWVKANSPFPDLEIFQTAKSSNNTVFFKQTTKPTVAISFGNSRCTDEAVIAIDSNASSTFDAKFDAYKLRSTSACPEVYILTDSNELSIQSLANMSIDQTLQLAVEVPDSGRYTFIINNNLFTPTQCVVFEDRLLKRKINIDSTTEYICNIDSSNEDRFVLHIGGMSEVATPDIWCNSDSTAVVYAIPPNLPPWNFEWSDGSGIILKSTKGLYKTDSLEITKQGAYQLRIEHDGICKSSTIEFEVEKIKDSLVSFTYTIDTLEEGYLLSFTPKVKNYKSIKWHTNSGVSSTSTIFTHYFTPGNYAIELYESFESGCSAYSTISLSLPPIPIHSPQEIRSRIYPNPAKSYIHFNETTNGIVVNAEGKVLIEFRQAKKLNVEGLSSGIYWVKLDNNDKIPFIKH